MQSLYEKDKIFTLQYIAAAENGAKISYRSSQEEKHREDSSQRGRKRQECDRDIHAQFGPPDKCEHFSSHVEESDDFQPLKKKKIRPLNEKKPSESSEGSKISGAGKDVEKFFILMELGIEVGSPPSTSVQESG